MKLISAFIILALVAGCSLVKGRGDPEDYHQILDAYFEENNVCNAAWERIVDEWVAHGGSISDDIAATRDRVVDDRATLFASLIREVWKRQDAAGTDGDRSSAFSEVLLSRKVVPERCAYQFWVQGALIDTPGAFAAGAMTAIQQRLGIADDRLQTASWAMSQLLISPANARK